MPKPSEIILIEFPFSSFAAAKRRPALIIHGPTRHGDILALVVTSKPQPVESVSITQGDLLLGSLAKPSWVRCDQLHTFDQSLIRGTIAILSPAVFARIQGSLCGLCVGAAPRGDQACRKTWPRSLTETNRREAHQVAARRGSHVLHA